MKFANKVKQIVQNIPRGRVSTYKLVAKKAGNSKASRAVGLILNRAHKKGEGLPCFRVVKSDGSTGGYALGSLVKKSKLLKEGIKIKNNKIVDFQKILI